jgi:hypothetical protein
MKLNSKTSMSNSGYHRCNKPNWWARVDSGPDAGTFLTIPRVRGDEKLSVVVDVPVGTVVVIGCGTGKDGVREKYKYAPKAAPTDGEGADKP